MALATVGDLVAATYSSLGWVQENGQHSFILTCSAWRRCEAGWGWEPWAGGCTAPAPTSAPRQQQHKCGKCGVRDYCGTEQLTLLTSTYILIRWVIWRHPCLSCKVLMMKIPPLPTEKCDS